MADRTVTVRLTLDNRPYIAKLAQAEAATKKFRKSLEDLADPFKSLPKEYPLPKMPKELPLPKVPKDKLPREGDDAAGAFARAFSKRLDAAFRSLPKAEITATSTDAQAKVQTLRTALAELSSKTVGVDIDAGTALAELQAIKVELETIDASADIDLRADTSAAISQIAALQAEVDRFNTDQAERELNDLTSRLDALRGRTIGVDLDAGAARAELAELQRGLESLNRSSANPQVRLDSARALTELRQVQAEMSDVGGRVAMPRVDANVSGALMNIGLVTAALASLPAVTSVAVGVGALGAAFGAAGAGAAGFAAVAIPAFGRVNDALKEQETAAGGAGGAVKSAAQTAAEAAQRSMQLEQAERRVTDAKKAARQAEVDLTAARRDARRAIEDMNLSLKDAALSEEDAALAVEEARARLGEVNADPKATELERKRADLSYREAVQRLEDQRVRTKRLQEDTSAANKAGVEGSAQVKAAKDKEAATDQALLDAKKQLELVMLQQKAAMQQAGGAAGGAASKMSELSKREKDLADDIKAYKKDYEDWQRSLEGDVFPAISGGLDLVSSQLPRISPLVKTAGKSFLDLEKDAAKALKAPFWDEFLHDLDAAMPSAIEDFGHTAGNVLTGLAGVMDALLPHADGITGSIEKASQRFADWGVKLKDNPDFKAFVDYAKENGPKVGEIFSNIAEAVGKIAKAGGEVGPDALDLLVTISEKIADLEPGQVQAIAAGIAGIMAAAKLGTALKLGGFVILADVLGKMSPGQIEALAVAIAGVITAVKGYQTVTGAVEWWRNLRGGIQGAGEAAVKARGPLSGAGGAAERAAGGVGNLGGSLKGGAIALGVGGLAVAAGHLKQNLAGLNPDIKSLADNIASMAKGGKPAPELLDQIGGKVSMWDLSNWEDFGDVASRLTSDNTFAKLGRDISGVFNDTVGLNIDSGAKRLQNIDKALAEAVSSGNGPAAEQMFNTLARVARDAGVPLDKLKTLFPEYTSAAAAAVDPTNDAAAAIGGADAKLNDFQRSMDAFTSRTDIESALQGLKKDYDDVKAAVEAAGGKLDFSAGMTDKQRDAVIKARGEFAGYIQKVGETAKEQALLGEKSGDATKGINDQKVTILNALPQLFKLAGNSKDAKDAIYNLGKSAGLSKDQINLAKDSVAKLRLEISRLQNKTITITATVKGDGSKSVGAGKALHADGAVVDYYASGGLREAHVAQIAPAGTMRVWAEPETGGEAYIPLAASKRARSLDILSTVADLFGQELVPAGAPGGGKHVTTGGTTSVSGSGGTGVVEVNLNNLDSLTLETGYAAQVVTKSVADAGAATAEGADQVGSAIESASGDLSGQISTLSGSIDRLAGSVDGLASSVSSAASAAQAAASSAASSASSKTASGAKPGTVAPSGPSKSTSSSKGKTGTASGSLEQMGSASGSLKQVAAPKPVIITPAAMADGGLVTDPTILVGEAGREMIVPLDRRARGRETLHQAASMLGYSAVSGLSGPRYSPGGGGLGQLVATLDERSIRRLEAIVAKARGVTVNSNTYYPVPEPTSTATNRSLQLASNLGLD
ncbi:hypothetical protein [Microbispora rosea]|uniref:hypothetical protein n=1 Tax=Microbispora rosea TaxID=58117 RepID=UPI0037AF70F9